MNLSRMFGTVFGSPEELTQSTADLIQWDGVDFLVDCVEEAELLQVDSGSIEPSPRIQSQSKTPKNAGLDLTQVDMFRVYMKTINRMASSRKTGVDSSPLPGSESQDRIRSLFDSKQT